MRSLLKAWTCRFMGDRQAMSTIEFALASASIAIVLSAALLAYGLDIRSGDPQLVASAENADPIVTGAELGAASTRVAIVSMGFRNSTLTTPAT